MTDSPTNAAIADELESYAALSSSRTRARTPPAHIDAQGARAHHSGPGRGARALRTSARAPRNRSGHRGPATELVESGEIAELRDLRRELRPELIGLGRLLGLSTRRTLDIGRTLGIETAQELHDAAQDGRLRSVPGIGRSTEAKIRAALARSPRPRRGLTLNRARALTRTVADAVGGDPAGDPRRFCELSFDLVVVCAAEDPRPKLAAFEQLQVIVAVVERRERRVVGVTVEGVPITLVVAEPHRLGATLITATGSPEYVDSLGELPDGNSEEAVYAALGVEWLPPELREIPLRAGSDALVGLDDVRGDLHCHSTWSDGKATIEEMARAARARGYDYLAVCDHTVNVRVVPGLGADDVRRQAEEIASINERLAPFRVLRGIECDILADGSLDLPDDVLAELEWVQVSLHAGQRRPAPELTKAVCEALRHPAARALSHPKGRILNRRPENALDLDAVFAVALEEGVALEINGLPDRLDLSGTHAAEALAAGVDLVLSSDSHSTAGLANMELAVGTARRAACAPGRVVNARPFAAAERTD